MRNIDVTLGMDGILTAVLDAAGRSVNVLNQAMLDEIEALSNRARDEAAVRGVLILSAKEGGFAAGGDLDELSALMRSGDAGDEARRLQDLAAASRPGRVLRALESCGKPVACVIAGAALGGGLELAMATHYRVAVDAPSTRLGLPEATLGLIPGAGGTQRLPRLIGIAHALPLLIEGRPIDAARALALGLVDHVASPEGANELARAWLLREKASALQPWDRKGFTLPGGGPYAPGIDRVMAGATAGVLRNTRGNIPAPALILECVYEGSLVPIAEALRIEARAFCRILRSPVALAMVRTSYQSVRELRKAPARPSGEPRQVFDKVGVIGAGMMGIGIARVAATVGIDVVLIDRSLEGAKRGFAAIERDLGVEVQRGKMPHEVARAALGRISPAVDYAALADAQLIVEAVFEDPVLKADVLRRAESALNGNAVIASNTSTLSICGLAKASKRPARIIGMHFFSPVHRMQLVEIIRGAATDDATLAKALDFALQLGKTPIVVNDGPGFYTSRVFQSYLLEGAELLSDGYPAVVIDNVGRACGMPRGPLELSDDVGLDIALAIRRQAVIERGAQFVATPQDEILELLVEHKGRTGRKGKAGFYDYMEGAGKTIWTELHDYFPIRHANPSRTEIEDIRNRLLFRQVVETLRVIEDGIISDPREIDVGASLGWGFPAWTGGPLSLIDQYGAKAFIDHCDRLNLDRDGFAISNRWRDRAVKAERFYRDH